MGIEMQTALKWLWTELRTAKEELNKIQSDSGMEEAHVSARTVEHVGKLLEKIVMLEWLLNQLISKM